MKIIKCDSQGSTQTGASASSTGSVSGSTTNSQSSASASDTSGLSTNSVLTVPSTTSDGVCPTLKCINGNKEIIDNQCKCTCYKDRFTGPDCGTDSSNSLNKL